MQHQGMLSKLIFAGIARPLLKECSDLSVVQNKKKQYGSLGLTFLVKLTASQHIDYRFSDVFRGYRDVVFD